MKLGLMWNFMKAIDREGSGFAFLQEKFPRISFEKLKAGIFDPIYPTPPLGQDMTQGQFFKRSLAGLNSEFSFS